jgi:uncharacterized membrane protein
MSELAVPRNRSMMIVLAYLWVLALIPLFADKQDAEVQWHAKNGLVLTVAEALLIVCYLVGTSIVSLAALGLGLALMLLLVFAVIGVFALHVIAILKAVNGRRLVVPVVSEYVSRL